MSQCRLLLLIHALMQSEKILHSSHVTYTLVSGRSVRLLLTRLQHVGLAGQAYMQLCLTYDALIVG